MKMNPSRKLSKAFVFIIPQVIRIHLSEFQLEAIVLICSPRRVPRRIGLGEVRIFVLIIPQVIQIYFGKWKVVVVCRPRKGPAKGVKLLQRIRLSSSTHFWE
jgi:hypothetical protein